jgi:hypothetical protein
VPRGGSDRLPHPHRPLLRVDHRSILCERLLATATVGGIMGDDGPLVYFQRSVLPLVVHFGAISRSACLLNRVWCWELQYSQERPSSVSEARISSGGESAVSAVTPLRIGSSSASRMAEAILCLDYVQWAVSLAEWRAVSA